MQLQMKAKDKLSAGLALAALALATPVITGCGNEEAEDVSSEATTSPATDSSAPGGEPQPEPPADKPKPPEEGKESGPADGGTDDPRVTAAERQAARAVRSFLTALDAGEFARACVLLAPDVLDAVELPEPRGRCPASLEASVGYRDPRGLPVWDGVEAAEVRVAELDAESAKVIATVVTRFADRDEPSIEDDIIYLTRAGDRWLIAKPSSSLYRAVGIADIPPSVLTPPAN